MAIKIRIAKEDIRYKPRLVLRATKVIKDKTKYNRKVKNKKNGHYE